MQCHQPTDESSSLSQPVVNVSLGSNNSILTALANNNPNVLATPAAAAGSLTGFIQSGVMAQQQQEKDIQNNEPKQEAMGIISALSSKI